MSKWLAIAIKANIHANIQAYIHANVCAIDVYANHVDISRRGSVVVLLLTVNWSNTGWSYGFQKADINDLKIFPLAESLVLIQKSNSWFFNSYCM